MILLDTNIFVDHLRNFSPAVNFFSKFTKIDDVFFSAITEAELLAGTINNDPTKREKLLHFLYRWVKVPVTNPIAVLAGDLSRKYGLYIPDAIIAATALENNLGLITKNFKDFKKVEGLKVTLPY